MKDLQTVLDALKKIRIVGGIAYVPLSKGREAMIDASDSELIGQWKWCWNRGYATRIDYSGPKRKRVMLHRLLMGCPDGLEVDHISGDGLDNRRANLRLATKSQNQRNQRISSRNSSGYKGVCWNSARQKWQAQINMHPKKIYLGLYPTPELAHAAYAAASEKLHGEFGRTA